MCILETEISRRVCKVNWDIWDKISDELFGFQQKKLSFTLECK